ncbi:MAG: hypothetical protein AB7P22_15330 [Vicinamibacterales bacterium]
MALDERSVPTAEAYLRGLQQKYGEITRIRWEIPAEDVDWEKLLDDQAFVQRLRSVHGDRSRDELRAILMGPPSEADRIRFIARNGLDGLSPHEAAVLRDIPVGGLPTNDPNAAAIRAPSGDPAVVVNTGMTHLLYRCANALVGSQPTRLTRAMWSEQQAMIWIVQGCVAMATGTASVGFERVPTFTDPLRMTGAASLADCATAFIVGHEYGHVQLGHLRGGTVSRLHLLSGLDAPSVEVYQKRHEQEFDADRKGAEFAVLFNRQTHRPPSQTVFLAIAFFFQIVRVLDICAGSSLDRASHPAAEHRWDRLNAGLRSQYADTLARDIVQLDQLFDEIRAGAQVISPPRQKNT